MAIHRPTSETINEVRQVPEAQAFGWNVALLRCPTRQKDMLNDQKNGTHITQ